MIFIKYEKGQGMKKINAKTLAGFMELTTEKQIVFNQMKSKIEQVFILNGLSPMDTPILEYSDVLLAKAGGDTEKQIYRFKKGDNDVCLRFDLTVPFAKYCAIHQNSLVFPFRRYQIGKVFRGERTQKGRFREFYQCDMDIIADGELTSQTADAECIGVLSQIFEALDVNIIIKISNRKIWKGFFDCHNIEEENQFKILNILDKKGKISDDAMILELNKFSPKFAKQIFEISNIKSLEKLFSLNIKNSVFENGLEELSSVFEILKLLNIKNKVILDLSIIRGLDYYTGIVFEAFLLDTAETISVGGGGKYENLVDNFSNRKLAGVGVSIGLTRLFDILDKNNLLNFKQFTTSKVAILPLGNTLSECYIIADIFRNMNIPTMVLSFDKTFKQKMNYANKIGVQYLMVIGENEINSKTFGLKNMLEGTVFEGSLTEITAKLGKSK